MINASNVLLGLYGHIIGFVLTCCSWFGLFLELAWRVSLTTWQPLLVCVPRNGGMGEKLFVVVDPHLEKRDILLYLTA